MNGFVAAIVAVLSATGMASGREGSSVVDPVASPVCANVQTVLILPQLAGPLLGLPIPPEVFGPVQPLSQPCNNFPPPTGARECELDGTLKDTLDGTIAPLAGVGSPLLLTPELMIADLLHAIEESAGTDGTASSYVDTTLGCQSTKRPGFDVTSPPPLGSEPSSAPRRAGGSLGGYDQPAPALGSPDDEPTIRSDGDDLVAAPLVGDTSARARASHKAMPQWPGQLFISLLVAALARALVTRDAGSATPALGIGRFRDTRDGPPPTIR